MYVYVLKFACMYMYIMHIYIYVCICGKWNKIYNEKRWEKKKNLSPIIDGIIHV